MQDTHNTVRKVAFEERTLMGNVKVNAMRKVRAQTGPMHRDTLEAILAWTQLGSSS